MSECVFASWRKGKGRVKAEEKTGRGFLLVPCCFDAPLFPAPRGRGLALETCTSGRIFLCCPVYPAGRKTEVRHILLVVSDLYLCILHIINHSKVILLPFRAFSVKKGGKAARIVCFGKSANFSTPCEAARGSLLSMRILTFRHPLGTQ